MRVPRSPVAHVQPRIAPSRGRAWLYVLEYGLLIAGLALTHLLSVYLWKLPNGDVKLYHDYALAFWTRRPFAHMLPVEYPPLAIVPFTLTLLPPIADYQALYAYWMGALVILGFVGFQRYSTQRKAVVYALYLIVGAAATLLARFDIVPALITLAALWATQRRRFGYAYVLIAVGVLLKLYPAFLLPVVLIAHARAATGRARIEGRSVPTDPGVRWWQDGPRVALRRLWAQPATPRVALGALLSLGLIVVGFACAYAVNPAGAFTGFTYASDRPLQVESTPASLLWLGTLVGIPARPEYSFVSLNFVGSLDALLKPLSAVALLAACGLVYWRQAQGRLTVGQAFLACLCAVLATNKIFSPQYLIWVLPIVAAVEGFDLFWLAVCVLTTINYPIIYQMRHPIWTVTFTPAFMLVLAARNLLLIYITVRAIIRPKRVAPGASLTSQRLDAALRDAASRVTESGEAATPGAQGEREGVSPALLGQG